MSFRSAFYNHWFIFSCSIFSSGLVAGLAIDRYFFEQYKSLSGVEKDGFSSDISILRDLVKRQQQEIYDLNNGLSSTREALLQKGNKIGVDNLSIQNLSQKYTDLNQEYQKLSTWYSTLQSQYRTAQTNCSVTSKINELEYEKRNFENQLKSVNRVFDSNVEETKQDIRLQIQQNHERLLDLQSRLSCS